MMVLVVFIHTLNHVIHPVRLPESFSALLLDMQGGGGLYLFISELISHSFGRIAVPFFFFVSGYLLLYKEDYSPSFYLRNLRKKVRTLLVPYVLWNLICLGIYYLKVHLSARLGLEVHEGELAMLSAPLWRSLVESVNFPLWYVRDLMAMNLILPLFYYLFRYTGAWGLLLLYGYYLTGVELPILGFESTAICYVGLGIYCGRNKVDVLSLCHRYRYVIGVVFWTLILLALYNNQHPRVEHLIRLYIPWGIATVLNVTAGIYRRSLVSSPSVWALWWVRLCRYCLPASFFVYVTHTLVINKMINRALSPLSSLSGYGQLAAYLLGVVLTITVCIIAYQLLRRLAPRLVAVLTGGR